MMDDKLTKYEYLWKHPHRLEIISIDDLLLTPEVYGIRDKDSGETTPMDLFPDKELVFAKMVAEGVQIGKRGMFVNKPSVLWENHEINAYRLYRLKSPRFRIDIFTQIDDTDQFEPAVENSSSLEEFYVLYDWEYRADIMRLTVGSEEHDKIIQSLIDAGIKIIDDPHDD